MKYSFHVLLCTILFIACDSNTQKRATQQDELDEFIPFVQRMDAELEKIISSEAKIEIIAEGFEWTEGPLWVKGVGLLFSDIPPNKIYKWTRKNGVKVYLTPSGYTGENERGGEKGSNGLLLDAEGNLVLCQHGDRRIARMTAPLVEPAPEYETIVNNIEGKRFNSPNDACYDSKGNLYFTDPAYGLEYKMDDPSKELDYQGVYRLSQSGDLVLLTDQLSRPNGIGLSPDEKTLYVANSDPDRAIWMAYGLNNSGNITEAQILRDVTSLVSEEPGLPDGLKVDANGNIFATGPGGVWILDPKGKVLGKIKTGQATSNCAIGEDGRALYITADMYVMRVDLIGS
jgi:gluconolactonase